MAPTAPAQQAPPPGAFFDVPGAPGGETQWLEEYEPTQALAFTLSQAAQTQVLGIQPFKQTDVVSDWIMELNMAQTYTGGSGQTLTNSEYAPHNQVGPVKLTIQNQYASVDVEGGIDLYIFNLIRPNKNTDFTHLLGFNPEGFPAGSTALGYPLAANAQANLVAPAQWANTVATYNLFYRLPAGQWFDVYYDRAVSGEPLQAPHAALVSPQYMAGTTRVITPNVKMNAMLGTAAGSLDQAAVYSTTVAGTGTTAASGTGSMTFRRKGVYAGSPLILPPAYPWQYRWKTDRIGIGGASQYKFQIPLDAGQVMACYLRLFDPAASTSGRAIALSAISSISLQYGSGLNRWTGTAMEWQEQWVRNRGPLLPPGVIAFDLAKTERGLITNSRVLNTLTTAGILISVVFTGAQSSTSYGVLGVESLVYVT